jgi:hypothetical protein
MNEFFNELKNVGLINLISGRCHHKKLMDQKA